MCVLADIKVSNSYTGNTALHNACSLKTPTCAELIIAAGGDIEATNDGLSTPLLTAWSVLLIIRHKFKLYYI